MKRFMIFACIGVLNTLVHLSLFEGMRLLLPESWAYGLAYGCALCGSYVLNSRYTYHQRYSWRTFWQFTGVLGICQFGLSQVSFTVLFALTHAPSVSAIATSVLLVPTSFWLLQRILTRKKSTPEQEC